MESNNNIKNAPSAANHAMQFGLQTGLFFGLKFIVSANAQSSTWMQMLSLLLSIYIIYCVLRAALLYRITECDGVISFREAFRYIITLFFFASIVAALVRAVYLKWFDSTFLSTVMEQTSKTLEQIGWSEADQSMGMESLKHMLQPVRFSLLSIIYDMMMGVLAALVLSPIVKRIKITIYKE